MSLFPPSPLLTVTLQTPVFIRPLPAQVIGYNRSTEPDLLGVTNDSEAVLRFLQEYQDSPATLRSYVKELERFLLWCEHKQIGLTEIKRPHALAYLDFLAHPPSTWCGLRARKLLKNNQPNKQWRPFSASRTSPDDSGLSVRSIQKSRKILDSFFRYLVEGNYLYGSPLATRRTKGQLGARYQQKKIERYLPIVDIRLLLDTLERIERCSSSAQRQFAAIRCRYIILLLFFSGLRISEAANHRMGDFTERDERWFLQVLGKGDKYREIPVGQELLAALVRFRQAVGFSSPYPGVDEPTPLIPRVDRTSAIGPRRIDQILKQGFALAARRLERYSMKLPEGTKQDRVLRRISRFEKASAHWLRHSYATYLLKAGASLREAMENLGHADVSTLMIYQHLLEDQRHKNADKLSLQEPDSGPPG